MTMRERLEAATSVCVIPGGKEHHLELVFAVCEKAKAPGASLPSQTTTVVDSTAASQETSEEAAA